MYYDPMVRIAVKRQMWRRHICSAEGKIEVVLKDTGRRVWVNPETVKENPSKYDKVPKSDGAQKDEDAKAKNPPKGFFSKIKEKAMAVVNKASADVRDVYENTTREMAQEVLSSVSSLAKKDSWSEVTPEDFSDLAVKAVTTTAKGTALVGGAAAMIASYKYLEPELTARYGEVVYTMMRKGRLQDVKSWQMALSLSVLFAAPLGGAVGGATGLVASFGPSVLFSKLGKKLVDKANSKTTKEKKSSRIVQAKELTEDDQKDILEFYAKITDKDFELLDFLHDKLKPDQWKDDKAFGDALTAYVKSKSKS